MKIPQLKEKLDVLNDTYPDIDCVVYNWESGKFREVDPKVLTIAVIGPGIDGPFFVETKEELQQFIEEYEGDIKDVQIKKVLVFAQNG